MTYEYPVIWPYPCKTCLVKGSWDKWKKEIPLNTKNGDGVSRGSVFLDPGDYEYKFIVDGEWKVNRGVDLLDSHKGDYYHSNTAFHNPN